MVWSRNFAFLWHQSSKWDIGKNVFCKHYDCCKIRILTSNFFKNICRLEHSFTYRNSQTLLVSSFVSMNNEQSSNIHIFRGFWFLQWNIYNSSVDFHYWVLKIMQYIQRTSEFWSLQLTSNRTDISGFYFELDFSYMYSRIST